MIGYREISEITGVKESTLKVWKHRGKLPPPDAQPYSKAPMWKKRDDHQVVEGDEMSDLVRLEAATKGLESLPTLEETPDYVGRLDTVIRSLQEHKRMIMSEVSGPVTGEHYRITAGNRAERSYNTAAILHRFV